MSEDKLIERRSQVVSLAEEIFGSAKKAASWLKHPNSVLAGRTPVEIMISDQGINEVKAVLGRIEWGLYS